MTGRTETARAFPCSGDAALGMGSELPEMGKVALRELGRVWDRLFWSGLVVVALVADVWYTVFPSGYAWSSFVLGLFTGMAFTGLAFVRARRK